jgi:hypothetical protein
LIPLTNKYMYMMDHILSKSQKRNLSKCQKKKF